MFCVPCWFTAGITVPHTPLGSPACQEEGHMTIVSFSQCKKTLPCRILIFYTTRSACGIPIGSNPVTPIIHVAVSLVW